jgi:hypothetical protein
MYRCIALKITMGSLPISPVYTPFEKAACQSFSAIVTITMQARPGISQIRWLRLLKYAAARSKR